MAKKNFDFKKLNLDKKINLDKLNLDKINLDKKINLDLGNLRDTLTDTISTVADKVLDFADSAADTAKVGQQIAKLFVEKKKEESALEDAYKELGKLYYDLHKVESEGALADLCMEIENTLVNIEDINNEIEALKAISDVELDDEMFFVNEATEDEGFLERMADTVEDALEGLDEAIEAALDKLEVSEEVPEIEDDEIEVTVEEYLDDDDFVAPEQDEDIVVEVLDMDESDFEEEPVAEA